jgi:hypothetical protein
VTSSSSVVESWTQLDNYNDNDKVNDSDDDNDQDFYDGWMAGAVAGSSSIVKLGLFPSRFQFC